MPIGHRRVDVVRIRQLEYFTAVAEQLSFTRAAASLGVSQPVVSRQIRLLEAEMGAPLLDRTSRSVALTDFGASFVADARSILETIEAARNRVPRRGAAALRIGTYSTAGLRLIREVVSAYESAGSGQSAELMVLRWDEVPAAILGARVDAAFITTAATSRFPDHDALEMTELLIDPRVAVVRRDHPLARRRSISVDELNPYGFVGTGNQSEAHNHWWNVDPRPDGSSPRIVRSVATVGELLETVVLTGDVAITTGTIAGTETRTDVRFIPIADVEPAALYIACLPRGARPFVRHFVEIATATAGRHHS